MEIIDSKQKFGWNIKIKYKDQSKKSFKSAREYIKCESSY